MRTPPLIAACLLLSAASVWAEDSAPASLIPNGDLEAADPTGSWPLQWPKQTPGSSRESEAGNHFLRLRVEGPQAASLTWRVKLPAGVNALRFTYRHRYALDAVAKPWSTAFVFFEFRDKGGKTVGPRPRPEFYRGTWSAWTDASLPFVVPKGAAALTITPTVFGSPGDAFSLDDLRLVATSSKEAADADAVWKAARLPNPQAEPEPEADAPEKWPAELTISGTRFMRQGQPFILTGVGVDALQWSQNGEYSLQRAQTAIEGWKANAIRLPFTEGLWNGKGSGRSYEKPQTDGGAAYRDRIKAIVTLAANRGAYVILDLHRFRAMSQEHLDAWKQVAEAYKNHPAVLFEIFNEPHGISWEVWRNGGMVELKKTRSDEDNFLTEEQRVAQGLAFRSPGMQAVVEAIRATGAKNIIIAGGLSHSGDLSGIVNGFALEEKGGNGIAYAWHQYWWHRGWDKTVVPTMERYPVIVTECGASLDKMGFINPNDFDEPFAWSANFLGFLQKHKLSYTAFSFHPGCGPSLVTDMVGSPTQAWGTMVKAALSGARFELTDLR